MVVSTLDRGRDAQHVRPRDTESEVSMLIQSTTTVTAAAIFPGFGDARLPTRFWAKVRVTPDGCWEWTASINRGGYAEFWFNGKLRGGHRVCYATLISAVSEDLTLDHLCRNRACVNPTHLEPVTLRENFRRGEKAHYRKAHCPRGHPYDYFRGESRRKGYRGCWECKRAQNRRSAQAHREQKAVYNREYWARKKAEVAAGTKSRGIG